MPAPELNQNPIGPGASCDLSPAHSRDLLKRPPVAVEHRLLAAEPLPPEHRHVDILRIDIHAVADSPGALGCDKGAATSQERVVASLPSIRDHGETLMARRDHLAHTLTTIDRKLSTVPEEEATAPFEREREELDAKKEGLA